MTLVGISRGGFLGVSAKVFISKRALNEIAIFYFSPVVQRTEWEFPKLLILPKAFGDSRRGYLKDFSESILELNTILQEIMEQAEGQFSDWSA